MKRLLPFSLKRFTPFLLLFAFSLSHAAPELIAGDGKSNRLRMIFLAEGYTAAQESKFKTDCNTIYKGFVAKKFYQVYGDAINLYAAFTPSQQSGADDPATGTTVNTAFDATFGANGIDRLLVVSSSKVNAFLRVEFANYDPSLDIVVVIVNSTKYGGSGGQIATTSVNSSAPEVAIHEVGHSFAALADEYETPYPTWRPREYPNATAQTAREKIPWGVWIESTTPVPTPKTTIYNRVIGLFAGAQYSLDWYRPYMECQMRSLGNPFCSVCTESHVAHLYAQISPVDSISHKTNSTLLLSQTERLQIFPLPLSTELFVEWSVNGEAVGRGNQLSLAEALQGFGLGTLSLTAEVIDTTGLMRLPENLALAQQSLTWTIDVDQVSALSSKLGRIESSLQVVVEPNRLRIKLPSGVEEVTLLTLQGRVAAVWRGVAEELLVSTEAIPVGSYLVRAGSQRALVQIAR